MQKIATISVITNEDSSAVDRETFGAFPEAFLDKMASSRDIPVDILKKNFCQMVTSLVSILPNDSITDSAYEVAEVQVSLAIDTTGGFSLAGFVSGNVVGKHGIQVKLVRKATSEE